MCIFNLDKYCQISLWGFIILSSKYTRKYVFLKPHQQSCQYTQFLRNYIQVHGFSKPLYAILYFYLQYSPLLEVGPCSQLLTVHFHLILQTEFIIFPTNLGLLHSPCSPKCASQRPWIYSWYQSLFKSFSKSGTKSCQFYLLNSFLILALL